MIDRRQLVLAALAAGGQDASFLPVQAQKLFFLIDREASHLFNGPHFNFQPYDYGPFDRALYECFDNLSNSRSLQTLNNGRYRVYSLTPVGYYQGQQVLETLHPEARNYLTQITRWVRSLSFQQLVTSIYNRYPEMKVNSVFR